MDEDEQLVRYERDGSVTLIAGARILHIAPGWDDAALDAAATAFFTADQA